MNNIGIRVQPNQINFAIFNSNENEIINVESIIIPKALNVPEQLKYVRNLILDLLREYKVLKAGIRITEPNSQNLNIQRLYIEGVIQETFASSSVTKYRTYILASMAKAIDTNKTQLSKYLKQEEGDINIDYNLNEFNREEIEAILAAMAVSK